jgi:uncharacterized protein
VPIANQVEGRWQVTTGKAAITAFVAQPALAIVGVSRSGRKFGNTAARVLREKGYRVYPVHPSADVIDGVRCYKRFQDLPEAVDALLVVVAPAEACQVVRDAAAAGIHHVWLQQGAESVAVLKACHELGLSCVWGECILMYTHPTGFHKAHWWMRALTHRLPV